MAMEYPLHLKRGTKFHVEGRNYTVHSRELFEDADKRSYFNNKVGIETTVGTFHVVSVSSQVETGFVHRPKKKLLERVERY